jgi:hypothetical protein
MTTITWQRIEGGLVVLGALPLAIMMQTGWPSPIWMWLIALLAPDLGALGYLAGPRVGAFMYNLTHLYGAGLVLALIGVLSGQEWLITLGAIWMVHIGADRALGFGLKQATGFRDTHLGWIGRRN